MQFDANISDLFPINKGIKQGYVLAPTLFGIYFSHVTKTTLSKIDSSTGISLLSREDGNYFNIKRFKALTKTHSLIIRELLYDDDAAALCASAPDKLQNFLNCFSDACDLYGLLISLKKIVVMCQSSENFNFYIKEYLKTSHILVHLSLRTLL